jgi:dephospho-CoA kinase
MKIVGLTGGTGAGKSSAARRFESHGITVVDADKIGHELTAPGGEAVEDLVASFGETILDCGKISRERLGALVFADDAALDVLNGIMQPRIASVIGQRCAAAAASGSPVTIVDAALLGDGGVLDPWVESLILVCCPEAQRVKRLVAHREMDPDAAWQRVRAQVDPEKKRSLAQWVIENDSSLESLHRQVDRVAEALLEDAGSSSHGAM